MKWQNPPVPGRNKHDHEGIAAALRSRPGEWALVVESGDPTTAFQMRTGQLKAYRPAGSFEVRTVRNTTGSEKGVSIYARFVGEQ